jgi:AcrR family transcriptional regulator
MSEAISTAKQALLEGATSLFLEHGFDAVSMEQVRLKVAVSNGSLYHHFPTKAHLARSVYLCALDDYQAHMMGAVDAGTPAGDGVRGLVRRHIAWVLRSPRQALVLDRLRPQAAIEGHAPDWEAVNAEAFSHLKAWIALKVASGDMLKLPFKVWLALVLGPSMQLTAGWAMLEQPSVDPKVRFALAEAAWLAVQAQPHSKGSR